MQTETISVSKPSAYNITVGNGIIKNCGEIIRGAVKGDSCLVVTDSEVGPIYLDTVTASLEKSGFTVTTYTFSAGEESKNLRTVENMLGAMCDSELTRTDFAVALGGGVCGDLTGFASAIYCRGIDYIGIPTSLLAQIDSSVGGKTGCDLLYGKNLVGAFHSPKAVIIDPDCLSTLPQKFINDGLAEAIKYGIICSEKLFDRLLNENAFDFLKDIITECVTIKRDITEKDFYEHGDRILLNLGHTMGHSIEKYYKYRDVTHGEGVGIGMVMMAAAAEKHGECEPGTAEKIADCLHRYNLPATTGIDINKLCEGAKSDKKRRGGNINIVVPQKIGKCFVKTLPANELAAYLGA